ncbi:hypothetical protein I553_6175 [Mycobacterium xenopi 4042]|uniref:Uncharacterized protein n=1 Tax=Mycobacterium xenopi 4042 TaxID=1299334 RepID=X8BH02_MYCXE|nr:hypothetical protein I553_6175 [Mycobacterium xenopi 4042]
MSRFLESTNEYLWHWVDDEPMMGTAPLGVVSGRWWAW